MKKILIFFILLFTIFTTTACSKINVDNITNQSQQNNQSDNDSNNNDSNENDNDSSDDSNTDSNEDNVQSTEYMQFNNDYSNTRVSYQTKILGEVSRNVPTDYKNEGLSQYPVFNKRLDVSEEEFNKIIAENEWMRSSKNTYDKIDSEGNMYLNGKKLDQKLYRHSASQGNYLGDVSDEEVAVVKEFKIYPDKIGSYVTGLYAPAGELIKVTISNEDLEYLNSINEKYDVKAKPIGSGKEYRFPAYRVILGQKQETSSQENNIWYSKKNLVRMPLLANTMDITETTAYVGSYLGGPIYLDLGIKNQLQEKDRRPITITVSGAVEYHHYIEGLTTREDYERTKKSSAPFFELAVTDNVVRHSAPRQYAKLSNGKELNFDDCFEAGQLWTKIANMSHLVPGQSNDQASISFLYEPFIAAGAAVAFPGRHWVNNPMGWMTGSLDAESFYKNGSWGNIHEYNHHHQNYGLDNNLEVSNNATSLLSYVSYTTISERRDAFNQGSYGSLMGDDWNRFLDPGFVLKETLSKTTTNTALDAYANFLHAFGVDTFIKATEISSESKPIGINSKSSTWYYATSLASGYDMTYYFEDILHINIEQNVKTYIQNLNMPTFIPAATIFQTGRLFTNNRQTISSNTTLPYVMKGSSLEIDLNKHLILPKDFTYEIVDFTSPESGTLTLTDEKNKYLYTKGENTKSGKMLLTIKASNASKNVSDYISFEIEIKSARDEVLVKEYKYETNKYNSNTLGNYVMLQEALNYNESVEQNTYYTDSAFVYGIKKPSIVEMTGKIYIPEAGNYRFGIKHDKSMFVYAAKNSTNLKLKAYSESWNSGFNGDDKKGFTMHFDKGDYMYFKLVVGMPHNDSGFMELGWSLINDKNEYDLKAIPEQYVIGINDTYIERPIETNDELKIDRLTPSKFNKLDLSNVEVIDSSLAEHWQDNANEEVNKRNYGLQNLFDDNNNTRYHSIKDRMFDGTKTWSITVDLKRIERVSSLEFVKYGSDSKNLPKDFKIYSSLDNKDFKLAYEIEGAMEVNGLITAEFKEEQLLRYIKIEITRGNDGAGRYISMAGINLKHLDNGSYMHIDHENIYYSKDDFTINRDELAIYGKSYETNNGKIKFSFYGKRFALESAKIDNEAILYITIDGTLYVVDSNNSSNIVYLSKFLNEGIHNVEIHIEGKFNFSAFRIYN